MSEYTPSLDDLREAFVATASEGCGIPRGECDHYAEFDRWLEAHDAEIRAEALETFAHEVRERYPEDVFPPVEADDHDHINAVLKTYVHVSRDRVSADVFRHAAAQADMAATEIRNRPEAPELFPGTQEALDALSIYRKG